MTRLVQLRPMLDAADLDATIAFYTDVLGFTATDRMEGWVNLLRDDVRVMFNQLHTHDGDAGGGDDGDDHGHEHPAAPAMTGSLYFNVDDVDALAAELDAGGRQVSLLFGPVTQPHGMRELGLLDPNGYVLVFGTPVDAG